MKESKVKLDSTFGAGKIYYSPCNNVAFITQPLNPNTWDGRAEQWDTESVLKELDSDIRHSNELKFNRSPL